MPGILISSHDAHFGAQESMIARGVASVRSPVCNLQQFSHSISHETFSDAVVRAFREEYGIDQEASGLLSPALTCTPELNTMK